MPCALSLVNNYNRPSIWTPRMVYSPAWPWGILAVVIKTSQNNLEDFLTISLTGAGKKEFPFFSTHQVKTVERNFSSLIGRLGLKEWSGYNRERISIVTRNLIERQGEKGWYEDSGWETDIQKETERIDLNGNIGDSWVPFFTLLPRHTLSIGI